VRVQYSSGELIPKDLISLIANSDDLSEFYGIGTIDGKEYNYIYFGRNGTAELIFSYDKNEEIRYDIELKRISSCPGQNIAYTIITVDENTGVSEPSLSETSYHSSCDKGK
jgi:hypothetical protein